MNCHSLHDQACELLSTLLNPPLPPFCLPPPPQVDVGRLDWPQQGCRAETNWTYLGWEKWFIWAKKEPLPRLAEGRFDVRQRWPAAWFVDTARAKGLRVLTVGLSLWNVMLWRGQVSKTDLLCTVMNPTKVWIGSDLFTQAKSQVFLHEITYGEEKMYTQVVWTVLPILLLKLSFWLQNHHRSICLSSIC